MQLLHIYSKEIVFTFLIFYSSFICAQVTIEGRISDSANATIEFATVAIKEGDRVLGSSVTDQEGKYTLTLSNKGNLEFIAYCVGYHTKQFTIHLRGDTIINITLSTKGTTLNTAVVNAKLPVMERKIDRLVFHVENSVAVTGGDAVDALKVTPGIFVSNDQISMIGKSGMKVMINDKLVQLSGDELINFLRSISVTNIAKIEVISNPSAKYDAEGNSGLINIQLKTARNNTWSATLNSAYLKNTYSTGRGGASFNYQKNKISFYANAGVSDGSRQIVDQSKGYYTDYLLVNRAPRKVTYSGISGSSGIEYAVAKRWKMGMQYIGSGSTLFVDNKSASTLYNNTSKLIDSTLKTNATTTENSLNHSININSTVDLDTTGKKIHFNVDYFTYKSNTDGSFKNSNFFPDETMTPNSYYSIHNLCDLQTNNYSGKIDIEQPFKKFTLSYGGKISATTTDNNLVFYNTTSGTPLIDPSITNAFRYEEQNYMLHISSSKKINKWDMQIGLRGENTHTKGTSLTLNHVNNYSYLKIFPTVYILYTQNDANAFALSYGRRINRPNYEQLNPFRIYSNPYSYVEGNPFLRPSFSDNIEFVYAYKTLENKLFYSKTTNGFQQLPIVDVNSIRQRMIVENFYNTHLVGISESFSFNKWSWLNSNTTFVVYYSASTSTSPIAMSKLASFNALFSTTNDVTISKSNAIFLNISYWHNFRGTSNLSKNNAYNQFDVAMKMLFLKKALTFSIAVQDVFSSNRPTFTQYSNGVKLEYKNYYDNRCLRVSLNYKFGNNKINVSQKEFGNSEEKDRTMNK